MQGNIDFLAAQQQTNPLVSFLPLILIVAAFYFFLIRPQNRRRREQAQMQNAVEPGARVLTTNGMYATVTALEGDHLVLEIAPGVEARFVKQSIMQVVSEDTEDTEQAGDAGETGDTGTGAGMAGADDAGQPKSEEEKSDKSNKSEG